MKKYNATIPAAAQSQAARTALDQTAGSQRQVLESGGSKHMSAPTSVRRFAILSILAAAGIHAANAQPAQNVGFFATLGGQVSSVTNFNSAGGTNTMTIVGTGLFQVLFPGLGSGTGSNIQVNAFDTNGSPHICTSQGWGSSNGTDVYAYVGCFDFAGNPYSGDFSIFYQARNAAPGGWLGFFWADQPTAASYTPNTTWNYNNKGGFNKVTRTGTGIYRARFPNLRGGGNPQVTAYSFDQNVAAHCEISSWTAATGTTTEVGVRCFDGSGNPADEYYSLSYNCSALESEGATNGAYGFAEKPGTARYATYTPKYPFSEYAGLDVTAERFALGAYSFMISNPSDHTTLPFVGMATAVGTAGEYCEVEGYDTFTDSFDMNVACYDTAERSTNARYSGTMLYEVH
jgi:hypothetical protein